MVYHIEVLAADILLGIVNQCIKNFRSAVTETEESFTLFTREKSYILDQFLLKGTSGVHLFSQQKP